MTRNALHTATAADANRDRNAELADATVWLAYRTTYYATGHVGRTSRVSITFDSRTEAEDYACDFETEFGGPLTTFSDQFRTWTFQEFAPIPF